MNADALAHDFNDFMQFIIQYFGELLNVRATRFLVRVIIAEVLVSPQIRISEVNQIKQAFFLCGPIGDRNLVDRHKERLDLFDHLQIRM